VKIGDKIVKGRKSSTTNLEFVTNSASGSPWPNGSGGPTSPIAGHARRGKAGPLSSQCRKEESWPAGPNRLLTGFQPKATREKEIIFYYSNIFINFNLIWIKFKFKLWMTFTHKIKYKSNHQYKIKYVVA
jgi:hypothetical protein